MTKNNTPLEIHEQMVVVDYLKLLMDQGKVIEYTALPNNTYTKSWNQKRKQKAEGLRPGFPDLCVVFPNHMNFIEMKRKRGGNVSKAQKDWNIAINNAGVKAYIAKGSDEAIEIIKTNLESWELLTK
jgi:hypothetical protein